MDVEVEARWTRAIYTCNTEGPWKSRAGDGECRVDTGSWRCMLPLEGPDEVYRCGDVREEKGGQLSVFARRNEVD